MSDRFWRHRLIPGWNQQRLQTANVIIAGVGALGSYVAETLALAGVGRLILCDPDIVGESNLSRAPLFRPSDVGRPKVVAGARALAALVPSISVDARYQTFEHAVGLGELSHASLVLSLTDNRASRLAIAGRCGLVGRRVIDAGTSEWGGEVRPFLDTDGPCFGCTLSDTERGETDVSWSCMDQREREPVGSSAVTTGLVGSFAAMAAVRALLGLVVATATLVIDGATGSVHQTAIARDPSCPLHEAISDTVPVALGNEGTVGDLTGLLPAGATPLLWQPVERRSICPACQWRGAGTWRLPARRPCPSCGASLRIETTLELDGTPAATPLWMLGVPPREILPVRLRTGAILCVELH